MKKNKNPAKVLESLRVDDTIIVVESGNTTGNFTKAYLIKAYQLSEEQLVRGMSTKRIDDTDWFIGDWKIKELG